MSTQASWEAAGAWNTGMVRDPLCPVPLEHFRSSTPVPSALEAGPGANRDGAGTVGRALSLDDGDLGSKLVDSRETPVTESGLGVWAWIWKNHKKSIEVEITPKTEVETPSVASFWKRSQTWEVMTP